MADNITPMDEITEHGLASLSDIENQQPKMTDHTSSLQPGFTNGQGQQLSTPSILQPGSTNDQGQQLSTPSCGKGCKSCLEGSGKFLVYLVFGIVGIVAGAIIIAALGVLTLPVSAVLLLLFVLCYIVIRVLSMHRIKNEEDNRVLRKAIGAYAVMVTVFTIVLLFSSLVVLVVLLSVPSLKTRKVGGLLIWRWIEIICITCGFCAVWMGSRWVLSKVQERYDYRKDLVYFTDAFRWTINCLCFYVGELFVIKIAPSSKKKVVIYGLPVWKWIAFIDLYICGCHILRIITRLVVVLLQEWQNVKKEEMGQKREVVEEQQQGEQKPSKDRRHEWVNNYKVYMAKGLRTSINYALFLLLLLLGWLIYVKPRLDMKDSSKGAKKFIDYAQEAFLSICIGSVVWAFKDFLLLLWKAREIYMRLTDKIVRAWMQVYFLRKISGHTPDAKSLDILSLLESTPLVDRQGQEARGEGNTDQDKGNSSSPSEKKQDMIKEKREGNQEDKLEQIIAHARRNSMSFDILKQMTKYILGIEEIWTNDENSDSQTKMGITNFCNDWKTHHTGGDQSYDRRMSQDQLKVSIKEVYRCELNSKDLVLLYDQLDDVDRSRAVCYADFEKWIVRAQRNCIALAHSLAGNKEAAVYLNKIMIGFIISLVIIIFLFLTNIATTQLIVLLTSPLLAATFIFGDSAKALFQGIIFAFAIHPFDVGDLCVVNGNQLEVKRIGIWKTIFYKDGCQDQELIYPNTALANLAILKHIGNLDLNDYVEFSLHFDATDAEMKYLESKFQSYVHQRPDFENDHEVVIKEMGDNIKMAIYFKHKMSFQDMTYGECVRKKNKSRSELMKEIRTHLIYLGNERKVIESGSSSI